MNLPSIVGNWVDLVILFILGFYAIEGVNRGLWIFLAELIAFVISLVVGLRFYPVAAQLLITNLSLPNSFANALGFLAVAMLTEVLLSILLNKILGYIPKSWYEQTWQKILGIIPALLNGLILISFLLTLFIALPIKPRVKADINNSYIGGYLVSQTVQLERQLADIFGGVLRDTLTMLTIEPQSQERVSLPVTPNKLEFDEESELQMFIKINQERRKLGISELRWNSEIVPVARKHSQDMWERRYFSHINPDGEDPGDRLAQGGVIYLLAGENLALAPTVNLAHQGLMNSEGHRKNILDPRFKKIGIGVVDGGVYGKMFTQNFTD